MKMSRFCTKKDIPCHQQGKQDGLLEVTAPVVVSRVVPSVAIKSVTVVVERLTIGMSGTVDESAVTAVQAYTQKRRGTLGRNSHLPCRQF